MEKIEIVKLPNGFWEVRVGDRYNSALAWHEVVSLVSLLTMPTPSVDPSCLRTRAEWDERIAHHRRQIFPESPIQSVANAVLIHERQGDESGESATDPELTE